MPQTPKSEVNFQIVLLAPPKGVDFALQLGKSPAASLAQKQNSAGNELRFEFPLSIVMAEGSEVPDFRGPACQGPKGGRFIYLCSGRSAGQFHSPWNRRLKVPLSGITRELVERASQDRSAVLETRVPGSARDGGPSAATVKPFEGWKLRS